MLVTRTLAPQAPSRRHIPPAPRVPGLKLTCTVARAEASGTSVTAVEAPAPAITLTDKALDHLKKLRASQGEAAVSMLLRVGVKQGGCSGLSYVMDFEQAANISPDDHVMSYEGGNFRLVTDPKSLLYLFGMRLDYSDALIGGGFQFHNPNAAESCGCGKSFGV